MHKITNIEALGVEYTVADMNGKVIKKIQVIPFVEILDAGLGPCNEGFGSISSYMTKSVAMFEGNEDIDPNSILWHATEDEEVVLSEVIEYAVEHDYDIIILEHLKPTNE